MIPRIDRRASRTASAQAATNGVAPGSDVARADLHCHSTASEAAKLGIQQSLGLPECATPPEEVYELAKRRGMDFVTITDHDTIDGCLELADRPDVFVSEELTAWFAGQPQAVHVLCYGIDPEDHEFLQAHAGDLEVCAAYLHEREIACGLAHPFFSVAAPLGPRHRSRLAELFGVWEVRNGSRARDLNMPAAVYTETHGGTGIGGSDDHAGVDIGRTWTETPPASTPDEFLWHLRQGRAEAKGEQGSAAKWAHSAMALASRAWLHSRGPGTQSREERVDPPVDALSPVDVLRMAERVVSDGSARGGPVAGNLGPDEGRAMLRAWLDSVDLDWGRSGPGTQPPVDLMQVEGFSHSELYRRARRAHERRLRGAVDRVAAAAAAREGYAGAARALFDACMPVVPYVPAAAFLARETAKLAARDGEPRRVALVVDGAGSMHGVSQTIDRIREHGVAGWEVEVIGTDPHVDRRLPAVAEVEVPFYAGLEVGVPSVPELVQTLAEGRYDLVHLASPGPAGVGAAICARIADLPLIGSYHTELAAYAAIRTGDATLETGMRLALALFYGQCEMVLSPSLAADQSLVGIGIESERIARWARGVDLSLYDPGKRDSGAFPGQVKVLYAGRLTKEKGVDLLAEAFLRARERDPRLHLLLAGGGPEEGALRERLGVGSQSSMGERDESPCATFLGWLDREQLARAYASADLFLFCSRTDTYGQVIAEAQASGLPVVAVAEGGPVSLISDRHTGWLCPPDPESIAGAVAQLASSAFLRERLSRAARAAVRGRSWEAAFEQLAAGYAQALSRARRIGSPQPRQRIAA
jgi:glycosyltransferase involved in cell wall biosynthesis/predicted metal-dependent phosphoesterase TrpH